MQYLVDSEPTLKDLVGKGADVNSKDATGVSIKPEVDGHHLKNNHQGFHAF